MLKVMSTETNNVAGDGSGNAKHAMIGEMLASAVNMEDDLSSGVYEDYMNRRHWPKQFDEGAFAEIKQRLTVLIEETKKHKKIIGALVREYGGDK